MSLKYNNSPYKTIPEKLKNEYTMNGKIPIFDWYLDEREALHKKVWDQKYIDSFISKYSIKNIISGNEGKSPYGHEVCSNLLSAFIEYDIKNKNVAVVGSTSPWIEAILINLRNNVTTIEYNVPETKYNNLQCKDYFNYFKNNKETYDDVVTFSSIEHSGLGRYGDPLDPNGDIDTMKTIHNNLVENGLVIWGAPVGKDALSWNAHRVYGPIRLPLMFNKFRELKWYGLTKEKLFSAPVCKNSYQPVIVLQKK
jgi:hypothetical protein